MLIILAVIVAVAVVGGAVAALVLLRSPPNMHITNYQLTDQTGCPYTYGGNVLVTFDLVNTGGNGFTRTVYAIDNVTEHTNDYYVASGSTLHVQDTVVVSDCNAHFISAEITNEWAS